MTICSLGIGLQAPLAAGFPIRRKLDGFAADAILVFFLCGVALAQPLYDVLSRGAELLVARRSEPVDVLFIAVALSLLAPAALLTFEILLGLLSRRARTVLHGLTVSALSSIIALSILKRVEILPGSASLIAAALVGTGLGLALLHWRLLRGRYFLISASIVATSLPLWFLFATPVQKLLFHSQAVPDGGSHTTSKLRTPVVLVVLDELPTTTLMNDDREVDRGFFPGFHALAANSTWYRNATTVADFTTYAVPAILTGKYPEPGQNNLPTAGDYPDNLFTLLGKLNELIVVERTTKLCPEELCGGENETQPFPRRLKPLFSDLAVVYGHIILPAELADNKLPPVTTTWRDFVQSSINKDLLQDTTGETASGRVARFRDFIHSIGRATQPALYYFHTGLPHHPWQYTPTGKRYAFSPIKQPRDFSRGRWSTDTWRSAQGLQRHIMQTMFIDRLVAEMLDKLKETHIYDRSLLIVTSDHGLSFRPGDSRRELSATNYKDVMPVPLFVKMPHQVTGAISDRNVELVDILPTIADVQRISIPWRTDGLSLADPSLAAHDKKTVFSNAGETLRFSATFDEKYEALRRKSSLLGPGADPERLYGISPHGPYKTLIGRRAVSIGGTSERIEGELDFPALLESVSPEGLLTPAHITGRLYSTEETGIQYLAVAINGFIRAITRTYEDDAARRFSAIVPESAFRPGRNTAEVFVIRDEPGGTLRLSSVLTGKDPYYLERTVHPHAEIIRSASGIVFPIRDHTVDGFVRREVGKDELIVLRGWARDTETPGSPVVIIVFEDSEFRILRTTHHGQQASKSKPANQHSKFRIVLPKNVFANLESSEVRLFGISGQGYASELRYSLDYPWEKRYILAEEANQDVKIIATRHRRTIPTLRGGTAGYFYKAEVKEGRIEFGGEIGSSKDGSAPREIVIFANGESIHASQALTRQGDADNSSEKQSGWRFMFRGRADAIPSLDESRIRFFVILDNGMASELEYSDRYPRGERSRL